MLSLVLPGLAACQSPQAGASETDGGADAASADDQAVNVATSAVRGETAHSAKPVVADNLPTPPGVGIDVLAVHDRDAMKLASADLKALRDLITLPPYRRDDAIRPTVNDEPSMIAQRAYARARYMQLADQTFQAISLLQQARRSEPNSPQILRALAELLLDTDRNTSRQLLERAMLLDPNDLTSAYPLGGLLLEAGQWETAIAMTLHAAETAEKRGADNIDGAAMLMMQYYLGAALERGRFDAEAVTQLRFFRDAAARVRANDLTGYRIQRLAESGVVEIAIGDALTRLGRVDEALAAYLAAAQTPQHGSTVTPRLVYALLQLDRPEAALDQLLQAIRRQPDNSADAELLSYYSRHVTGDTELTQQLLDLYRRTDRPSWLAVTLTKQLQGPQQKAFIEEHLTTRPDDEEVVGYLLTQSLKPDATGQISLTSAGDALRLTAKVIESAPERHAIRYGDELIRRAGSINILLQAVAAMPQDQRQRPAMRYLHALLLAQSGRSADTLDALRNLVQDAPDFLPARIALIGQLLKADLKLEARQFLAPLKSGQTAAIIALRAQAMAATGEARQAIKLLDEHIRLNPAEVDLILTKAQVQLSALSDPLAAERTLLDALNVLPQEERIYEVLVTLYNTGARSAVNDWVKQYKRLMRRMLGEIPHSRIARITLAETHVVNRNFTEAERLLRSVLAERPMDYGALDLLLETLVNLGRTVEAQQLLTDRLTEAPGDAQLVKVAEDHYVNRIKDIPRFHQVLENFLILQTPSTTRDGRLAGIYMLHERYQDVYDLLSGTLEGDPDKDATGLFLLLARAMVRLDRVEEIDDRLAALIQRFPALEADLMFNTAMAFSVESREDLAENQLLKLLARHPDHADANNHLGYTWADAGRHLDRAEKMIIIALQSKPNSEAFIDSLGWVAYKKREFKKAVALLHKAVEPKPGRNPNPVILDHLADALYRLNRTDQQALRMWQQSLALITQIVENGGVDTENLRGRLPQKIEAFRKNEPVQTSPVADEAPEKP